jgi:5-methylcytosine-specific restriction endonuclease McrA
MRADEFAHLSDTALLDRLTELLGQERVSTATLVACIAEVDARKLYLPAAHPSMHSYCVHVLHLSKDAAYKRITAARAAREVPAILIALAEGRLHLTAISLVAPHLTRENASELLEAAEHRTRSQIEQLLARRFPKTEMLPMMQPISHSSPTAHDELAPERVETDASALVGANTDELAPERVESVVRRPRVAPISAQSYELHVPIGADTHEMLRNAQALLGHRVRPDDIDEVLRRALKELVTKLEKQKFGASTRPQRKRRSSSSPRHIPAHVKRAVRGRDGEQCTYVGEAGQRCPARQDLEFDHVDPVARGGQATVENVRLRCGPHNQYTAECTFGAGFMDEKREEARRAAQAKELARAEAARAKAASEQAAKEEQARAREEQSKDLICGLRNLGFRADQARRAAESTATMTSATLEERIRAALKILCPKRSHEGRGGTAVATAT